MGSHVFERFVTGLDNQKIECIGEHWAFWQTWKGGVLQQPEDF